MKIDVSYSTDLGYPILILKCSEDSNYVIPNEGLILLNPTDQTCVGFSRYPVACTLVESDLQEAIVSVSSVSLGSAEEVSDVLNLLNERNIPFTNSASINSLFVRATKATLTEWNAYEELLVKSGYLPCDNYVGFFEKPKVDTSSLSSCLTLDSEAAMAGLNFDKAVECVQKQIIKGATLSEAIAYAEKEYGEFPLEFYLEAKKRGLSVKT